MLHFPLLQHFLQHFYLLQHFSFFVAYFSSFAAFLIVCCISHRLLHLSSFAAFLIVCCNFHLFKALFIFCCISYLLLNFSCIVYSSFFPQLALRRGDRLAVVSKAGDDRGWWKGQVQVSGASKKIGYFPKKYVKELRDDFAASSFALPNFSHA